MLPDRADEVPGTPELSAPQLFLDFRASGEDFSGRNAFDDLDEPLRAVERYGLHEKMHMVFICPNLKEGDLVSLANRQTGFLEFLIHRWRKDHPPILGWADDVVEQH